MKLPLRFGLPLLVGLWLASGYTPYGQGKTLLMVLAMAVALWTAFSLPLPRRRHPEEVEEEEGEEESSAPFASQEGENDRPANGGGWRRPPDARDSGER